VTSPVPDVPEYGSTYGSAYTARVPVHFYLLSVALVYNAPLLLAARLARNRLNPSISRSVIAAGFGVATGSALWRLDWYDVWRHGVPANPALLTVYAVYCAAYALMGWFLARFIAPPRRLIPR
jgi:hypothetical protein